MRNPVNKLLDINKDISERIESMSPDQKARARKELREVREIIANAEKQAQYYMDIATSEMTQEEFYYHMKCQRELFEATEIPTDQILDSDLW